MKISTFEGIAFIIGGICLFFIGMSFFNGGALDSIKKRRYLLNKLDRLGSFGYFLGGVFSTAVVQSSDATTILSMKLTEEKVLDEGKALSFSFGARVGTTITAILASLGEVGISSILIGISLPLALFCPKKHPNVKRSILGFSLFFLGLFLLKQGTLKIENLISFLFSENGNCFFLFFIGLCFTAIIQSSSATSSILVILTSSGVINFSSAFFIYLGATVGTTATPLLAGLKMEKTAKRIAVVYALSALLSGLIGVFVLDACKEKISGFVCSLPKPLVLSLFALIYSSISGVGSLILQKPFEFLSSKIKAKVFAFFNKKVD